MNKIQEAKMMCKNAHKNQTRKYTGEKYFNHPFRVYKILEKLNASQDLQISGLLHDVLEDTDVKDKTIKEKFGVKVLKLVKEVTGYGNIKTREGLTLKLADMLDNIKDIPKNKQYLKQRIQEMNKMQKRLHYEKNVNEIIEDMV